MSKIHHFLIAGATGRQGGAVVDALLTHENLVRPSQISAISRQPRGAGASTLEAKYPGINIVSGDLSDPGSIFGQFDEATLATTAVFLAQAHGPTELSDAKLVIDTAASFNIPYFVYSSVDRGGKELSDKDPSYCKTFSDKFYIEQHLRKVCENSRQTRTPMGYTILRPTWFADNAFWGFPGRLCMTGWRENMEGKKMQVTVTKDIGRWAAEALIRPEATDIENESVSIASDILSFDDVDQIFKKHTGYGVPVINGFLARFIIWMIQDLHTMFGFIGERSYGADLEWLGTKVKPTSFESWVQTQVAK